MKPPAFWWRDGLLPRLLAPAACVSAMITRHRMNRPGFRADAVVICCGGATVGGAGKTTLALALAAHVSTHLADRNIAFVTRGYGGLVRGPLRVDPAHHDATLVGDEALLLAASAPCFVARDRAAGARAATAAGADMLILDDGLQNPFLQKDLSFLTIDGASGFGNGRVMPAGPLREPVRSAAARCGAAVLIGEDRSNAMAALPPDLPVLRASLHPTERLDGVRVFALAGIAFPAKFHATLRQAGATLAGRADFPDHHPFTQAEIEQVLRDAAALNTVPVTTPKDAVRLPAALRAHFRVVGVQLAWDDPVQLDAVLHRVAGAA